MREHHSGDVIKLVDKNSYTRALIFQDELHYAVFPLGDPRSAITELADGNRRRLIRNVRKALKRLEFS